jgi:hypothetical protein
MSNGYGNWIEDTLAIKNAIFLLDHEVTPADPPTELMQKQLHEAAQLITDIARQA